VKKTRQKQESAADTMLSAGLGYDSLQRRFP
jgi:hypothetical protein